MFSTSLFGQNPHYFAIDKTKGLPSNIIYDILQDKSGLIWLTTNDGICSYDGKKFNLFSSEAQVSKSGSNIREDQYGRIWYCTFDGYIFYVQDEMLKPLNQKEPLAYKNFDFTKNNLIYFEGYKVVFLDLKTLKRTTTITLETDIIIDTQLLDGVLYIYTKEFLYEIKKQQVLRKTKLPEKIKKDFSITILSNTEDQLLLISKYAKKYCIYAEGTFEIFEFKNNINFIQNANYIAHQNWVATTKGVLAFDAKNPNIYKQYFDEFNISSIFQDKEGNYWFGTLGNGLLLVPNFKTYLIPTNSIPSKLKEIDNKLIFSTQNDQIYESIHDRKPFVFKQVFNGNSNHVMEQFEIDTIYKKIYCTSNTFKTLDYQGKILTEQYLATKDLIAIDRTYYAYAASGTSGLFKVSNHKSKWDDLFKKNAQTDYLDARFSPIIHDIRGKSVAFNAVTKTIYFATNKGLFAVNDTTEQNILWKQKTLNLSKIISFQDVIYGLTANHKLIVIDRLNNVKSVNIALENEPIRKIKLIESSLFLFTNQQILRLNLETSLVTKVFNLNANNEITDIIKYKNEYLLASSQGLIHLDENDLKQICIPKLLLKNVFVNGKKTSFNQLESLKNTQNSIEIQYAVISFVPNLQKVLYYKINQSKWQTLDDESRSLKLSSLASGSYLIQFKTAFGSKFSPIQSIKINIKKPFTENILFYVTLMSLLVTIIIFFYRHQIKKIKQRNQLLLEKIELEKNLNQSTLKSIKSQMNPHFFYNALNTIQSYILANDKKQAVNYLSKFSSLTRTILEMSERETVTITEEIKTLSFYLDIEKARFNNDFEYQFLYSKSSELEHIKIPSLLLQPYVENAIKHGLLHKNGDKKLTIDFQIIKSYVVIAIKDNGIGRAKSEALKSQRQNPHQSFATQAMNLKIELLNKHKTNKISIKIIDQHNAHNIAQGTVVLIKIPLDFYFK